MSKDAMRQKMPTVAGIVDEYRAWLEDGGRVVYASEAGHVIDRREPEPAQSVYRLEASRFHIAPKGKK